MIILTEPNSTNLIQGIYDSRLKESIIPFNIPGYYVQELTTEQGTGISTEFQRLLARSTPRDADGGYETSPYQFDGNYLSGKVLVADNDQGGEERLTVVVPDTEKMQDELNTVINTPGIYNNHYNPGAAELAFVVRYASYSGTLRWSLAPNDNQFFLRLRNNGTVAESTNQQIVNYYDKLYKARIRLNRTQQQVKIDDEHDLTLTTGIWLERSLPESEQGYRAAIPPAQYQARVIEVNPETGVPDAQTEYFEGAAALWEQKRDKAQRQRKDRTQQELDRLETDDTLTLEQEQQLIQDYEAIAAGTITVNVKTRRARR